MGPYPGQWFRAQAFVDVLFGLHWSQIVTRHRRHRTWNLRDSEHVSLVQLCVSKGLPGSPSFGNLGDFSQVE